ncbi:MAG: symmetrical bis(5'-nucleosyl)-tetraphosphatase [Mariprofundaceae bacterium]
MAVYAVGDIQGCFKPLKKVLKVVKFDPGKDQLWCVGDLVNRGPDSLKVLRYLKSLGDSCIAVLGNHDLHLLELVAGGKRLYDRDTFDDVFQAPDRDELIKWLRHRPLLHHDKALNYCMVHAGLHPAWQLKKIKRRAKKVEKILQSDDWQSFCQKLHHHDFPRIEPDKRGLKRMLFSTAVLTRTRYCTQDGVFNWGTRSGESSTPEEKPWFAHSKLAWRKQCRVVYGHWAAKGLVIDQKHVLGLDSGCVWGGSMTLARLDCEPFELTSVTCEACQPHA